MVTPLHMLTPSTRQRLSWSDMWGAQSVVRKTEMFRIQLNVDVHTLRIPTTANWLKGGSGQQKLGSKQSRNWTIDHAKGQAKVSSNSKNLALLPWNFLTRDTYVMRTLSMTPRVLCPLHYVLSAVPQCCPMENFQALVYNPLWYSSAVELVPQCHPDGQSLWPQPNPCGTSWHWTLVGSLT